MTLAYYSEFDPFAASWLMRLIAAGHIAPGVVDTRDLWDVTPNDLRGFTQVHFCAGIGVWSYALRRAGWPDDRPIWTASFPCQPFSAAGKGLGFADERHLWPAGLHLIEQCDPSIVIGEQVASKNGLAWLDLVRADVERTGRSFAAADLCAAGVGAPHIRQRSFWMAHADGKQIVSADATGFYAQLAGGRTARRLADADGRNARAERQQRGGEQRFEPSDRGFAGPWKSYAEWFGVCWHSECRDSDRNWCDCDTRGAPDGWCWDDDDGWMAHAVPAGRAEGRTGAGNGSIAGSGQFDRLGNTELPASERQRQHGIQDLCEQNATRLAGGRVDGRLDDSARNSRLLCESGLVGDQPATGPTNGYWRDADWLYCRDGKWRPVEPGTFPLAHGATNRVGRLRGYGNAIVAPVAETFIRAMMDSI